jgi:hypothetical protein
LRNPLVIAFTSNPTGRAAATKAPPPAVVDIAGLDTRTGIGSTRYPRLIAKFDCRIAEPVESGGFTSAEVPAAAIVEAFPLKVTPLMAPPAPAVNTEVLLLQGCGPAPKSIDPDPIHSDPNVLFAEVPSMRAELFEIAIVAPLRIVGKGEDRRN